MRYESGTFKGAEDLILFRQCWLPENAPRAVIVVIHGFGEHSGRYMNLVKYFVPRGYAICAFDQRGHGRSPGQRGHVNRWEEYTEDVDRFLYLIQGEHPGVPRFLFGHSMGGLIALDYALEHPDRITGVIVSGPVLSQPRVAPWLLWVSRGLSRVWPRLQLNTHLDAEALSRDPEVVHAYQEDPLVHSMASARLGTELSQAVERVQNKAQEWQLPLLILHGAEDRVIPVEGSRRFFSQVPIKDKQLIEYPHGYHEPHNDLQKAVVLRDMEKWLDVHLS